MENKENMNSAINEEELEQVTGGSNPYELVSYICKQCGYENYKTVCTGEDFEIVSKCHACKTEYVFTRSMYNR